jgi:hypothetical protein
MPQLGNLSVGACTQVITEQVFVRTSTFSTVITGNRAVAGNVSGTANSALLKAIRFRVRQQKCPISEEQVEAVVAYVIATSAAHGPQRPPYVFPVRHSMHTGTPPEPEV